MEAVVVASRLQLKIGEITDIWLTQDLASPRTKGKILRKATQKEFIDDCLMRHPDEDISDYIKDPELYHYEVSVD